MHVAMQRDLDLAQTLDAVNLAEQLETDEVNRMVKAVSDKTDLSHDKPKSGMLHVNF